MVEPRVPWIFIAEDDEAILDLLVTRLRIAGYHTSHEKDGMAALEAIRRHPPNACLLDVNMPRLDGFQVLKRLRADPLTAHVPVLILTARRAPDDIKTAIKLGATDYLSKPFSDEQLLARVARLLRKRAPTAPPSPPPAAPPASSSPSSSSSADILL
jgi:two-component system OmpR family response regulator